MRVVITVASLDGFHGSVMHVREWLQALSSRIEIESISLVCYFYDDSVDFGLNTLEHKVYRIEEITSADFFGELDLILAFHFPLLDSLLLRGVKAKKIVSWSLSPYEAFEAYPFYWQELSILVANSEETKRARSRVQHIPKEKIIVVNNSLPVKFLRPIQNNLPSPSNSSCLNIVVVSNHIPRELHELIHLTRVSENDPLWDLVAIPANIKRLVRNLSFVSCGIGGDLCKEIEPNFLNSFDVIISIGKTVQYGLGMGISVFEYDRFGGRGYITPNNYNHAREFNFSGRPEQRRLSAVQLAEEIWENYHQAQMNVKILQDWAKRDFLITKQLEELLNLISKSPTVIEALPRITERLIFSNSLMITLFETQFKFLKLELTSKTKILKANLVKIDALESELSSSKLKIYETTSTLSKMLSSKAYRVALILRKIKQCLFFN